ncbi:MAG: aminotransferase class I/II-fold pyridoxal phosphate-dependent enzyme, partial [Rikenellaceae bacterium]|nr:aminotransferase class I/II-fold pyridoxal phosphate-dependent enzyme [Rikenellaceae bacterium]
MKIKESGVALSHIVEIGENLAALSARTGAEYLRLNRGINSVVNIDLREVIAGIDFNTAQMQTYPPGRGFAALRDAINAEYFGGESSRDNLLIVPGAMNGLDLLAQSVDIERLYLPVYYWGCYFKLLTIRGVQRAEYPSLDRLESMIPRLTGCGVLICDPGNPLGQKYDDARLLALLRKLDAAGVTVFFDSPYRRVFRDATDTFYREIRPLRNVAIVESFSKSMGLSGQRIGFIHTTDPGLYAE